jgi:hypothetical protein
MGEVSGLAFALGSPSELARCGSREPSEMARAMPSGTVGSKSLN